MSRLEVKKGSELLAWTDLSSSEALGDHRVVVAPLLYLSQLVALELASRISYSTVFKSATIDGGEFLVVHATFDLYRTGRAAIVGFGALVVGPGPLPPLPDTIRRTAQMIRGYE